MKHRIVTLLALLVAGVLVSTGCLAAPTQPTAECLAYGRASFTAFAEGHYDRVRAHFAPGAVPQLTAASLKQLGGRLHLLGAFESLGRFEAKTVREHKYLAAPLAFAGGRLAAIFQCNAEGRITKWGLLNPQMFPNLLPPPTTSAATACAQHAHQALLALTEEKFKRARKHFSPTTAKAVSAAKLKTVWQQLTTRLGAFRSLGPMESRDGGTLLVANVNFAHANWEVKVSCDAEHRITKFLLSPRKARAKAPTVDKVSGVISREISVPSPLGPLKGTLDLPAGKGPFPAVVFASGSGPVDRDETVGIYKPFRDIAVGLAKAGIASLRFDKRLHDYLAEMQQRQYTVDEEETDDVLSALKVIATQNHINTNRLFVIGHSEGAMLAPRIAKRSGRLAGIVMMAAPARPLLPLLVDQFRYLKSHGMPAATVAREQKAIAAEQKLIDNANPAHPPKGKFMFWPQSWWLSLHDYHQVKVAKSLHLPMLFLQGGKDYKVSPSKDFDRWKKVLGGRPNVTFRFYPNLIHLFIPYQAAAAHKPAHVSAKAIHDIATWIKAQPTR